MPILEVLVWVLCLVVVGLVILHLRRTREHSPERPAAAEDLFETAPIGYLEIDQDGIVKRANRQYARMLGRGKAELIGKHCEQVAPPALRAKYTEQIGRRMSREVGLSPYQRQYERPDGSTVVVEVHEELLTSPTGQVTGMRMAAVDVTERKQSDEQAFQIATELRALFQAFPDFFLRLDRDGKVQDAKGGEKGDPFLVASRFSGRSLKEVLPPEAVQQFSLAQEQVKRTKSLAVAEFIVETHAGLQNYEMRLLELDWEWIAIVRNITARKTDETKLRDYAQELERKHEAMETALITAREATQLKSRFLATISHEIRTPMNGVLGMTDLLLGTALKAEQQEYAQSIKRSASSLLALINDILDLSRIEAGKLDVQRVSCPLKAILEETVALFAPQARVKGLEFLTDIAPNVPPSVLSDPVRLRQVLNNLLGNAIKFTDAGRISLTCAVLAESSTDCRIRVTVKDTGIGISPENHARIFERFTQADTSNSRKYGGTGLGLAISKELVELLGGQIGVESELDRGSQFWFTINVEKAMEAAEAAPESAAGAKAPVSGARPAVKVTIPATAPRSPAAAKTSAASAAPKSDGLANLTAAVLGQNKRVLIAEDNEVNKRITVRLLEKLGLSVDAVTNGREAVEALGKKNYGLILMDCQMPEMDGFEATAVIRNRERSTRHTPICALTANAMEGDRERCLAAGMDDYIAKPVSIEKLQDAIARWMPQAVTAAVQPAPGPSQAT